MGTETAELALLTDMFFRAVSFEIGQIPTYGRVRGLFIDGGTLINNSSHIPEIWSVAGFIASRRRMVESGTLTAFEEREITAATDVFGSIAHRLSAYEKRGTREGRPFVGSGLISTQFVRAPGGWKMSSMAWDDRAAIEDGERPRLEHHRPAQRRQPR